MTIVNPFYMMSIFSSLICLLLLHNIVSSTLTTYNDI